MPITQHAPPPQSHIVPPKESPSASKLPVAEIVRPTSPPTPSPESPKPRGKSSEPDGKPVIVAKPVSSPPTPAATTADSDPEPEEQVIIARYFSPKSVGKYRDDGPADDSDADASLKLIDMETFAQILELDEDEETHDFSRPMVWEYFDQAEQTFINMDSAIGKKDLPQLSALGHFLKGSSAALGLSRVQDSCERIQHYGHLRDEVANQDLKPSEALSRITKIMKRVKVDYNEAKIWLKDFYGDEEA